jgi:retron-type reverse transcriptase
MLQACNRTRGNGAPGVDGLSGADFGADLGGNLQSLLNRAKSGTYRAPPVRRVHIPKGTGNETRPIGIPTFEDKVLQRAVVMALEPIYEEDFLPCSYGFRPGRSAHMALQSLRQQVMALGGCWVVEVDIQKFFDTLDRAHLRQLLRQRVRDGVLLRCKEPPPDSLPGARRRSVSPVLLGAHSLPPEPLLCLTGCSPSRSPVRSRPSAHHS